MLLELGNQSVPMLDHFGILFVLVIWPCRLNDALDSVYRAWDTVASNKFGKVPENKKFS